MQVKTNKDFLKLNNNNKFIGSLPKLNRCTIHITGTNNVIYCESNVILSNCDINLYGSNSLIYFSEGTISINLTQGYNTTLYIGKNNFMHNLKLVVDNGTNIFIGADNMISWGCVVYTSDRHCIYDLDSSERINYPKDVYIGDHVWLAQEATILKGTKIGTGGIVGAKSVVSNKKISACEMWAGNPAKLIRERATWGKDRADTVREDIEETKFMKSDYPYWNNVDKFKVANENNIISAEELDLNLNKYSLDDRIKFLTHNFKDIKEDRFLWKF